MQQLYVAVAGCTTVLVLAGSLPASAADADRLLPNDTSVVWTMNVRQVLDSPLVKKHALEQIKDAIKGSQEVHQVLDALGFDPLQDVERITAASPALAAQDKWTAIVYGKFDAGKFRLKADEVAKKRNGVLTIHQYGNYRYYEVAAPGQQQTAFVALLNQNTLVAASSKDYVLEALDKETGKKKPAIKKELNELLEKLDGKQSFAAVSLAEALRNGPLGASDEAREILDKLKHVAGGIGIADDIRADFTLLAKDPDAAKELAEKISNGLNQAKGIISLMAVNTKELEPLIEILGAMKVQTRGSSIQLKGQVSKEFIEKTLKKE